MLKKTGCDMKSNSLIKTAVLVVAGCMTVLPAISQLPGSIAQQDTNQKHMSAALGHLQRATQRLQQATNNAGGHRERAMQITQQAASQVEQGIQYAAGPGASNTEATSPAPTANIEADKNAIRIVTAYQQREPNMADALHELAAADRELEEAGANKGGHRGEAMQLIMQAESELEQGIQQYSGGAQPSPSSTPQTGRVRITNGPVIERADQNSATIAWSTDRQGSSVIDYGTDPNNLNQMAESPWGASGLTHRVELKNLKPGTRYYFEVETGQAKGTNGGEVESNRFAFQTPNVGQPPIQNQHPQAARF
jgi:hypothetical protein